MTPIIIIIMLDLVLLMPWRAPSLISFGWLLLNVNDLLNSFDSENIYVFDNERELDWEKVFDNEREFDWEKVFDNERELDLEKVFDIENECDWENAFDLDRELDLEKVWFR